MAAGSHRFSALVLLALTGRDPAAAHAQAAPPSPLAAASAPAASLIADAPSVVLSSGVLRVRIALPDAQRGFYRSTRFDWSGMITQVSMGTARFYGPWFDAVSPDVHDFVDTPQGVIVSPRDAATGPVEEFANRDGETVPGYNAAPAGGSFVKLGVGRLRKDDLKPYDHFAPYTILDGGRWTVRHSRDAIVFTQRLAPGTDGYGYLYEKTIRLAPGGVMVLGHRLRNIGSTPIHTQVYNHNLARFDGSDIGPGVSVHFPFVLTGAASDPRLASVAGDTLRYIAPLEHGDRLQLPPQPGDGLAVPGAFRVTGANGASITMQTDTPLVRSVLWSIRHVVAVEPFTRIDVAPGAEQRWSWRYTFATGQGQ